MVCGLSGPHRKDIMELTKKSEHAVSAPKTDDRSGWTTYGYNPNPCEDVLRRVNRQPIGADGKPTVQTVGNVVTITMPNTSQFRLTMNEKAVPKPVTAADVKKWEFLAAPAVAK